jgi:hypothetical protein
MAPGIVNDEPELASDIAVSDKAAHLRPTEPKILSKATGVYEKAHKELIDRHIDEPRALKVAVIGGGLSGILAGVLLPPKVPGLELTIYEKNQDFVCGFPSENIPPYTNIRLT